MAVCELCAPQDHMAVYRWCGNGCPPSGRLALCKAYIAKAVRDFAIHTREKAGAKPKAPPQPKRGKRGRRRKDEPPAPTPDPSRLQQQLERDSPACMTARLPSPWRR